jgi:hypothetical protein
MTPMRWIRPLLLSSWGARANVLLASTAALAGSVAAGGASPVRTLLTVWVLGVCPGLAVIGVIGLRDPWIEVTLVVALSLALDVIVAGALTYTVGWSPDVAMAILLTVSLVGAVIQGRQPRTAREVPGR